MEEEEKEAKLIVLETVEAHCKTEEDYEEKEEACLKLRLHTNAPLWTYNVFILFCSVYR